MSRLAFASCLVVVSLSARAHAQDVPSPSPAARVDQTIGLTDVSVEYSSPAVKGRKIWGTLVPYDQLWRAGANMATKVTFSRDVKVGGQPLKAGSYALYMTPGKATWTIHFNSNWNTGGTNGYDAKNDVAKLSVKPTAVPARERLTYLFTDTKDDGASLDLEWEKLRIRIPIAADTKTQALASIERATADAWRPHSAAAQYLLDTNGDLDKALVYIDKSIAIQPTWRNEWVRAQVQGKKGNKAEAMASAERAHKLGAGNQTFEQFFKADLTKMQAGWK
jgi:Protein of unknown function (DUF2911)